MNWLNVLVRTSEVSQDCCPGLAMIDSRKDSPLIVALPVALSILTAPFEIAPIFSPVRISAFWKTAPPIPPLTTEFQSCRPTRPAAIACESWYMAVEACCEFEPERAAKLAIPLMADTDLGKSTPAAVKVPMLRAIWEKL